MANEKATIDIEVKTKEAVQGLKELRNELKAAKAQALNGDGNAAKRVAELTDKFDDLKDSVKTLQGSGIEKASSSVNLLGDGFRNLDLDKVKIGLTGLKTALASTGILLLVQGVTYLIENFDELSQGSGLLAKSLRFAGDIVSGLVDAMYSLTDAIGLTNSELDKQGESIKTNADKASDALANQTAEFDRQIAVAKASGKNAIDLEIAKQQAIINTNKALVEQTIAYVRSGGELNEDQKKLLTEQLNSIKNAVAQTDVLKIQEVEKEKEKNAKILEAKKEHDKKLRDDEIARFNEYLKSQEDELSALKKRLEDEHTLLEQQRLDDLSLEETKRQTTNDQRLADAELKSIQNQEDLDAQIAFLEAKRQIELQDLELTQTERALINEKYSQQEDKLREDKIAKEKEAAAQITQDSLQAATQLTSSLQSLSDAYFYFKTKNLKKGSAEELAQAKKQFDINKGISIANATISGIQGVVNALSAQSVIPEPFGAILKGVNAVAVGAAAAVNISKIASTKFNPGGGGGGGGGTAAPSIPAPPTISTPSNNVSGTQFDEQGNTIQKETKQPTITVKAQVVETEITDKQKRISNYNQQSTF